MNALPIEIINHIRRFNSHPLADQIKPHIITISCGTYIYTDNNIKWLHKQSNLFDDSYETYIIEHTSTT